MHVCLGMNLVAGTVLKPGEQPNPENHQYGTIALILAELLGRGARPNPESCLEEARILTGLNKTCPTTVPPISATKDRLARPRERISFTKSTSSEVGKAER